MNIKQDDVLIAKWTDVFNRVTENRLYTISRIDENAAYIKNDDGVEIPINDGFMKIEMFNN